jgi:arylsulfatase A-like enzyme
MTRYFFRCPTVLLPALALLVLLGLARWACAGPAEKAARPPNILFILTDDQRFDVLGCAGHPVVQTPAMDGLAGKGVRFRNAFVTTSICAASRASILTGLHERTHKYTFGTPPIRREHTAVSYPALLRRAGYRTGLVGKLGVEVEPGELKTLFDVFVPQSDPFLQKQPDGTVRHLTDITTEHALNFLRGCKAGQPFCLAVCFNAPHGEDATRSFPWQKSVDHLYRDVQVPPPRLGDPAIFAAQPDFLKTSLNRKRWHWYWDTPRKYQENMKAYFRMITGVDQALSKILAETKRLGMADRTVVLFASDNGYYLGDRGFEGKWSHYEESLRIPLIICDPRLPPDRQGRVVEDMALNIDIPSTILDLGAVLVPDLHQGRSLVALVRGEKPDAWRTDFFCEHLMRHPDIPKWEGVRGRRWVYARYFEQKAVSEFLHDLATDPDELTNLAKVPRYGRQLQEQQKRCNELRDGY